MKPDPEPHDTAEPAGGWRTHMHFDAAAKRAKAVKIATLIEQHHGLDGARILDIGTGIGAIAERLAEEAGVGGQVTSIDTMDTRVVKAGYSFQVTSGTQLPFADRSFDVVVSNHVVEHVGSRSTQSLHLSEIGRVLADDGAAYLATPTRWALIEPHFKLPLLSWLPKRWRNRYVSIAGRGKVYDVEPFSRRGLRRAAASAGLRTEDVTLDALEVTIGTESGRRLFALAARTPRWLRSLARPLIPTIVLVVRRSPTSG